MYEKLKDIFYNKFYLEISIAILLFILAVAFFSIVEIIIYLLYFVILLEIVRAVIGFLREQRVRIWILVDASIVLTLRELIVNVVKVNKENLTNITDIFSNHTTINIFIFGVVLLFLFVLRFLAMHTAPDKKKKKKKRLKKDNTNLQTLNKNQQ